MTDRVIVYPGSGAQDTDILRLQQYQRRALSALARMMTFYDGDNFGAIFGFLLYGASGYVLTITDGALIGPLQPEDTAAFGSLSPAAYYLTPVSVRVEFTTLDFSTHGTNVAGTSVNHLIYLTHLVTDTDNQVLYYENAANPSQVFRGVNNNGLAQPTTRQETVTVNIAFGTAATTGTQTTPAVPTGGIPLYVVTMAYGDATLNLARIVPHPAAPFWSNPQICGGNPNGAVAGFAARAVLPPSLCFDYTTSTWYTCTTTGDATHAIWTAPPTNTGPTGAAGRGIAAVGIDGSSDLILTYTDGSTVNAGLIPPGPAGPPGAAGPSGTYSGSLITENVFVTSGAYTVGPTTNKVKIRMCGGGGGGGGALAGAYSGGGGGAGAYLELVVLVSNNETLVFTVGEGGNPNVPGYAAGAGHDTAIGRAGGVVLGVAAGGQGGGSGMDTGSAGGDGGVFSIEPGIYGVGYRGGMGGDGHPTPINGQTWFGGNGAPGPWGGGGRAGTVHPDGTTGFDARSYGAGAGGAYLGTGRGGSGYGGIIHIEEYH